jgi:hypothetical protein
VYESGSVSLGLMRGSLDRLHEPSSRANRIYARGRLAIDTLMEADVEPAFWVAVSHVSTFSRRLARKGFAAFGSKA